MAFDVTFAARNEGGSGGYLRSLLPALQAREDVEGRSISGPSRSDPMGTLVWLAWQARRELIAKPPDLLHCLAYVCPWHVPVPFVVTVPDALARSFPGDHPLEWRLYERWILPERARAAARVITETENSKKQLVDVYGVEAERVVVTSRGIEDRFFMARRGRSDGPPVLLFPGAPIGRKNLTTVLRAMATAPADGRLARSCLRISGATADRFPEYATLVRRLGLDDRVRWLGRVPDADMPALIADADVVVYPSLGEGFGAPALEAMAVGTPVVTSNVTSLPEVVGEAALLVDPTDVAGVAAAVERILAESELRARMIAAGKKRARRYTWPKVAELTVKAYREALAG